MEIDVCYNCTRWVDETHPTDPTMEWYECPVRKFQTINCLKLHPQCPFFDMKDMQDEIDFAPSLDVPLTWQDLWQGGFDMTNNEESNIVKGGGLSKPRHMSDDEYAEYKRTAEGYHELTRQPDPEEPDDDFPDIDLDCDVRHTHPFIVGDEPDEE